VLCGKKNMAMIVSSAAIRRSVDRSKSTYQSSDSGRLRIIWEASTTEHPCLWLQPACHRAIRIAKGVASGSGEL
jgi:hypothetical protein